MKDVIYIEGYPYLTRNILDIYPRYVGKKIYICFYVNHQIEKKEMIITDKVFKNTVDCFKEIKTIFEKMEFSICEL